jgi:hypothetical protein
MDHSKIHVMQHNPFPIQNTPLSSRVDDKIHRHCPLPQSIAPKLVSVRPEKKGFTFQDGNHRRRLPISVEFKTNGVLNAFLHLVPLSKPTGGRTTMFSLNESGNKSIDCPGGRAEFQAQCSQLRKSSLPAELNFLDD